MSFSRVYSAIQKRISKVKLDAATGGTEAIVVFFDEYSSIWHD